MKKMTNLLIDKCLMIMNPILKEQTSRIFVRKLQQSLRLVSNSYRDHNTDKRKIVLPSLALKLFKSMQKSRMNTISYYATRNGFLMDTIHSTINLSYKKDLNSRKFILGMIPNVYMKSSCSYCMHKRCYVTSTTLRRSKIESKSYYEILGVSSISSKKEIKSSFYELSKKFHPDVNPSKEASEKFVQVSTAYSVLMDDQKRKEYDTSLGVSRMGRKSGFRYHSQVNNINPDDWIQYRKSTYPGGSRYTYPNNAYNRASSGTGSYSTRDAGDPQAWADQRTSWRDYQQERESFRANQKFEQDKSKLAEEEAVRKKMMFRLAVMLILLLTVPDILI